MTRVPLRRWQEEGATKGELDLMRAAKADIPSAFVRKRTMLALGLGTTGLLAAPGAAATHAATKLVIAVVAKWTAIGAVCGVVVTTTAHTIVSPRQAATPSHSGTVVHGQSPSVMRAVPTAASSCFAPDCVEAQPPAPLDDPSPPGIAFPTATASALVTTPTLLPPAPPMPLLPRIAEPLGEPADRFPEQVPSMARSASRAWYEPSPDVSVAPRDARSSSGTSPDLARELRQLDRARQAIAEGAPQAALAVLQDYETQLGHRLSPEALVLRVQALWNLGDKQRARALVEQYTAANPNSPYKEQLRRLVQSAP